MAYRNFRGPLDETDRRVLDAAAAQHRERGSHRLADVAAAAGLTEVQVHYRVDKMKKLGLWPHTKCSARHVRPPTAPRYEVTAADVEWALSVGRRVGRDVGRAADECESAALVGLADAAEVFDPSLERVPFRDYAKQRVRGAAVDFLRTEYPSGYRRNCAAVRAGGRPPRTTPLYALVANPAGRFSGEPDRVPLGSTLPSGDLPVGWELEWEDELRAVAARLTPYQRRVFLASSLEATKNKADVARRLKLHETMIGLTLRACYEAMRRWGVPHRAG